MSSLLNRNNHAIFHPRLPAVPRVMYEDPTYLPVQVHSIYSRNAEARKVYPDTYVNMWCEKLGIFHNVGCLGSLKYNLRQK